MIVTSWRWLKKPKRGGAFIEAARIWFACRAPSLGTFKMVLGVAILDARLIDQISAASDWFSVLRLARSFLKPTVLTDPSLSLYPSPVLNGDAPEFSAKLAAGAADTVPKVRARARRSGPAPRPS
jgi:hypothetical protein